MVWVQAQNKKEKIKMILDCFGYWSEESNDFVQAIDCLDGTVVKSYQDIEENKDVAELDPGMRCTDRQIHVPIICCSCCDEEENNFIHFDISE